MRPEVSHVQIAKAVKRNILRVVERCAHPIPINGRGASRSHERSYGTSGQINLAHAIAELGNVCGGAVRIDRDTIWKVEGGRSAGAVSQCRRSSSGKCANAHSIVGACNDRNDGRSIEPEREQLKHLVSNGSTTRTGQIDTAKHIQRARRAVESHRAVGASDCV